MKTIIIILLILLPSLIYAQHHSIHTDHHIKARQNAYASIVCIGIGSIMGGAIIASDVDNASQAAAVFGSFGMASTIFYLFAWHHVGEAGRQTSLFIKPEGVTLSLNF